MNNADLKSPRIAPPPLRFSSRELFSLFLHVLPIDLKLLPCTRTLPFLAPCNMTESRISSFPSITTKWLSTLQSILHLPPTWWFKSHFNVFDLARKEESRTNGSSVSHASGPSIVNGHRNEVRDGVDNTWYNEESVAGCNCVQSIPWTPVMDEFKFKNKNVNSKVDKGLEKDWFDCWFRRVVWWLSTHERCCSSSSPVLSSSCLRSAALRIRARLRIGFIILWSILLFSSTPPKLW